MVSSSKEEDALSLSITLEKGLLYRGMIESFGNVPLQQQLHAISNNFSEYQYMATIGAELQLVFPRCIIMEVIFKYSEMVARVLSMEMLSTAAVVLDVNADDLFVVTLPSLQQSDDSTSSWKSLSTGMNSALRRARHAAYSGMHGSRILGISTSAVTSAPLLVNRQHMDDSKLPEGSASPHLSPNFPAILAWMSNTLASAKHDSHLLSCEDRTLPRNETSKNSDFDLIFVNMVILSNTSNLSVIQLQHVNESIEVNVLSSFVCSFCLTCMHR
jgi:hypothetical protein